MKKIGSIIVLFSIALVVLVSSCAKEDQNTPMSIDTTLKATITGKVTAQLDLTNSTTEVAPANTKLLIKIDKSKFIASPAAGVDYGFFIKEVFVNASGFYTVQVPVIPKGLDIVIVPTEFTYDQVTATGNVRKEYTPSVATTTITGVLPGDNKIQDISYN